MNHPDLEFPLLGWSVWYGDGSVCNSETHAAAEVPDDNVQAVVAFIWKEDDIRRIVFCGIDEYVIPGTKRILYGRFLGTLEDSRPYDALKTRIHADTWRPATS